MNKITVAYSSDNNYIRLLAVSMVSLFESNKEADNITVYCLLYKPSLEYKKSLVNLAHLYNRTIVIIETSEICSKMRFWEKGEDGRYIRLLLPYLIEKEDLVLYLDCDIMVRKSLIELFKTDISKAYHAAVLDTVRMNARIESDISDVNRYFNSGVMLINLDKWREDNLVNRFRDFKLSHENKGIYRDQRILNGTTADNYIVLHPKYNFTPELIQFTANQIKRIAKINDFYSQEIIDESKKDPYIVHFSGRSIDRPWFKNCEHPFKKEYHKIMSLHEFTNFPLRQDKLKSCIIWKTKKHLPFFLLKWIILHKNRE